MSDFIERLKNARKRAGLSTYSIAEKLGIKQGSYTIYERQDRQTLPTINKAGKIAALLNVSLDYLEGLTDDPRSVNQILAESAGKQANEGVPAEYVTQAELAELKNQIDELKARLAKLEK